MQQSEIKMFSDEIARLEAEADEAQKIILGQTERLRTLEQRISALKSVVAGTQTRLSVTAQHASSVASSNLPQDVARPSSTITEEALRSERSAIGTTLYGLQRAYSPDATDVGTYRALASPFALGAQTSANRQNPATESRDESLSSQDQDADAADAAAVIRHTSEVVDTPLPGRPSRSTQADDRHKIDQRL